MAKGDGRSRKAHVKRIFAIDPTSGINTDLWIDVMRLDKISTNFNSAGDGILNQQINYVLLWNDDQNDPQPNVDASNADVQFENANAARTTTQLEVKNPDEPDDPTQSVFLWIVEKMRHVGPNPSGNTNQIINLVFDNNPAIPTPGVGDGGKPNAVRQVTVINVVNNDLAGNAMDDGNGKAIIADWQHYLSWLAQGQKDTGGTQYSVEVADQFQAHFQSDQATGKAGQIIQFVLDNSQFEPPDSALFDLGDPSATDADGNPCVIRADPLQVIVNIGNGLAVIFGPLAADAPD